MKIDNTVTLILTFGSILASLLMIPICILNILNHNPYMAVITGFAGFSGLLMTVVSITIKK